MAKRGLADLGIHVHYVNKECLTWDRDEEREAGS